MFGGTFAAKGGIRPADRFEFELEDPVLKRSIGHGYDVIALPVLGADAVAMTGNSSEIGWRRVA